MALDLDFGGSDLGAHAASIEQLLDFEFAETKVVARVGLGFKLAGQTVKQPLEWAYRVYVAWQDTAAASTAAFEAIPSQVNGVKTDVFFDIASSDSSCQSELVPGMKLTPCKQGSEFEEGYGTIGLVVENGADRFVLTDAHVLLKNRNAGDPDVVDVYVPDRKSSLTTRPVVATSVLAQLHHKSDQQDLARKCLVEIDVGLAKIAAGIEFSGEPVDAGGPVTTTLRDLIAECLPAPPGAPIEVWKYGARTELTHGVIVEVLFVNQFRIVFWLARAQPTEGATDELRFFVSKTGVSARDIDNMVARCRNRITTIARDGDTTNSFVIVVSGPIFSWKGDSGSAVYDAAGKLVGLVKGGEAFTLYDTVEGGESGVLGTHTVSCEPSAISYIAPAFAKLGLTSSNIVTASAIAAGAAIALPGAAAAVRRRRLLDGDLAGMLARSPAGGTLHALADRHGRELVRLVHHHRRVTVAWHRGKAAAFSTALLGILDGSRTAIPAALDGVTAGAALRTLFAAMAHEASPALQDDLARHAAWIAAAAEGAATLDDLQAALARTTS